MRLVVASMNRDKLEELRELLAWPGVELLSLRDAPGAVAPEENGATLLDNARIKARAAVVLTGEAAVADDTGLEVEALGGAPGVHTARFAGAAATYAQNTEHLLARLEGVPPERRGARFRTVCVVALPDGREVVAEGVLEGWITQQPRGNAGFGYDPVFELADHSHTLAELPAAGKHAVSHRARAVRALKLALSALLEPAPVPSPAPAPEP